MKSHNVMVALDNFEEQVCYNFVGSLSSDLPIVKIGLEMFYKLGPDFVRKIHGDYGKKIFLDLKLHDIPNTVSKSMKALKELPIDFLTVHLSGGLNMLKACQEVRAEHMPNVNILGVSYLTSLDKSDFKSMYGIEENDIPNYFNNLFNLAIESKTQGIVCSAQELELLKDKQNLQKVCPGIRFADEISSGAVGDQKRVLTPALAFENGATYLVMGRSLTQAKDLETRIKEINQ